MAVNGVKFLFTMTKVSSYDDETKCLTVGKSLCLFIVCNDFCIVLIVLVSLSAFDFYNIKY